MTPKQLLRNLLDWWYTPEWAVREIDDDLLDHLDPNNPFQIELGVGD